MVSWWGNCSAQGAAGPLFTPNFTNSPYSLVDLRATEAFENITLNSSGQVIVRGIAQGTWIDTSDPAFGAPSDWEVRLVVDTGDAPTSGEPTSTWLGAGLNRFWEWRQTGTGTLNATFTVEARKIANPSQFADGTGTVVVEVS